MASVRDNSPAYENIARTLLQWWVDLGVEISADGGERILESWRNCRLDCLEPLGEIREKMENAVYPQKRKRQWHVPQKDNGRTWPVEFPDQTRLVKAFFDQMDIYLCKMASDHAREDAFSIFLFLSSAFIRCEELFKAVDDHRVFSGFFIGKEKILTPAPLIESDSALIAESLLSMKSESLAHVCLTAMRGWMRKLGWQEVTREVMKTIRERKPGVFESELPKGYVTISGLMESDWPIEIIILVDLPLAGDLANSEIQSERIEDLKGLKKTVEFILREVRKIGGMRGAFAYRKLVKTRNIHEKIADICSSFYLYAEKSPEDFRIAGCDLISGEVPSILAKAPDRETRIFGAKIMFRNLSLEDGYCEEAYYIERLKAAYENEPDLIRSALSFGKNPFDSPLIDLEDNILCKLWEAGFEGVHEDMFRLINSRVHARAREGYDRYPRERLELSGIQPVMRDLIREKQELLMLLPIGDALRYLMHYAPEELVSNASTTLMALCAKNSKTFNKKLSERLSMVRQNILEKAGWMADRRKGVKNVLASALIARDEPDALPYLERLREDRVIEPQIKDLVLKTLRESGVEDDGIDERQKPSARFLEEQSKKFFNASMKKKMGAIATPGLKSAAPSITWNMLGYALMLTEDADDGLPDRTRWILDLLPDREKHDLSFTLFSIWKEQKFKEKHRWLLRVIAYCGDHRLASNLAEILMKVKKAPVPRYMAVVEALVSIGTPEAIWHILDNLFYNQDRFTRRQVRRVFFEMANKHKSGLERFYSEVLNYPVFPECRLDTGHSTYSVRVAPDFTVRAVSDTGRQTKAFPKRKKDEDENKHRRACLEYEKIKQQFERSAVLRKIFFREAILLDYRWPMDEWKSLLRSDTSFAAMARTLIWTHYPDGKKGADRFRPTRDGSFVTVDSDTCEAPGGSVGLWHPMEAAPGETGKWREHFKDYEIVPFVDQPSLPFIDISELSMDETVFHPFENYKRVDSRKGFENEMKKLGVVIALDPEDKGKDWMYRWFERHFYLKKIYLGIEARLSLDEVLNEQFIKIRRTRFYSWSGEGAARQRKILALGNTPPRLLAYVAFIVQNAVRVPEE